METLVTTKGFHKLLKRSPEALNNPYYKIVPKLERRNMWGSSEFGSFEEGQDNFWKDFNIDGDYGMKSPSKPRYSQNVFNKYNGNNRRQRNMKFQQHSNKKTHNNGMRRSELDRQEDNEILGSGNFVIVKGGTFYGTDRSFQHSGYPKNYGNYYGRNQFQNFKDFADLKKYKDRRRF